MTTTTTNHQIPAPQWADSTGRWDRAMPVDGAYDTREVSRRVGRVHLSAWQLRHDDGRVTMDGLSAFIEESIDQPGDALPESEAAQWVAAGLRRLAADALDAAALLDPPRQSGKGFDSLPLELRVDLLCNLNEALKVMHS